MNYLAVAYLFLPMFVANAIPVVLCHRPWVQRWNRPIAPTLLGAHKTYGGFLFGIVAGILVSLLQFALRGTFPFALFTMLHSSISLSVLVGFLLGAGALVGDSVKSFGKRRLGLRPGAPLPVFDGVDYVIGAIVFLLPLYMPTAGEALFLMIIGPLLSLAANMFSYSVGWKEVWY